MAEPMHKPLADSIVHNSQMERAEKTLAAAATSAGVVNAPSGKFEGLGKGIPARSRGNAKTLVVDE